MDHQVIVPGECDIFHSVLFAINRGFHTGQKELKRKTRVTLIGRVFQKTNMINQAINRANVCLPRLVNIVNCQAFIHAARNENVAVRREIHPVDRIRIVAENFGHSETLDCLFGDPWWLGVGHFSEEN